MVQKQVTELQDDLDGGVAVETVGFGLDGKQYAIDLSAAHAAELRNALDVYTTAARLVGKPTVKGKHTAGGRASLSRGDLGEIRSWANAHGYTVAPRGRVPFQVVEAYDAAN